MNVSELRPARPLVWINGFPGTGKYTIAKHLTTLLHDYSPLLIDNHSLIDPVEAEFSREDPNYQLERRRGRETVFKNVVQDAAVRTRNLIFTDFQSDNELGHNVAKEYEAAASGAERLFLPIYLECDITENLRRISTPQREGSGTTKLLSPDVLTKIRSRSQLFHFKVIEGITLDVTDLGPEAAAGFLARDIRMAMINLVDNGK